jgi:hypothetical protein
MPSDFGPTRRHYVHTDEYEMFIHVPASVLPMNTP